MAASGGNSRKGIKSKGYAAYDAKGELKPIEFSRKELGPHDVLVDIYYCGICHSDVHHVRSEWRNEIYPMVPGHEIVGKVSKVGSSAKKLKIGDIVGVGCMVDSCGDCDACKHGFEYACSNGGPAWTYGSRYKQNGNITFGGYANNIVTNEKFAFKINPKADMARTAPLLCAGTTTYTPLSYWNVGSGTRVGIAGLGGLGHIAVKIAKSMGADVTVFTTSKDKAKDAIRLGADDAVLTIGNAPNKHMGKLDFVLDTISAKHNIDYYLSMLRLDGKMVIVGLQDQPLSVQPFSLVSRHRVLAGSGLDGTKGTQEMLDYCTKNGITADIELIPIQKVNVAYDRLVNGDVKYRFVIDISTLGKSSGSSGPAEI